LHQQPFREVQAFLRLTQFPPQVTYLGFELFQPSFPIDPNGRLPKAERPYPKRQREPSVNCGMPRLAGSNCEAHSSQVESAQHNGYPVPERTLRGHGEILFSV
jgi:hypothetical protein